jgi:hypothetical protein
MVWTTTLYAGLLGLVFAALSGQVMWWRFSTGVVAGDAGDESKMAMIRAQANFFEYVPICLVLLMLLELNGLAAVWSHALGAGLVVARVLHGVGMTRTLGISFGRRVGTALTMAVLLAAATMCLVQAGMKVSAG